MMQTENPFETAAKGAVAGLVGTAVLTAGMKGLPALMQQFGLTQPEHPSQRQGDNGQQAEEPTEKLADQITTTVANAPLEEDTKKVAGQAIHWGYGAAWGAFYGLAQNQLHLPHHLHGLLFGGLVGTVASTLVPAMGLTTPPTEQPLSQTAMMTSLHLLYGWVTAQTFHVLSDEDDRAIYS